MNPSVQERFLSPSDPWEDDEVNPFLLSAATPIINEAAARTRASAHAAASEASLGADGGRKGRGATAASATVASRTRPRLTVVRSGGADSGRGRGAGRGGVGGRSGGPVASLGVRRRSVPAPAELLNPRTPVEPGSPRRGSFGGGGGGGSGSSGSGGSGSGGGDRNSTSKLLHAPTEGTVARAAWDSAAAAYEKHRPEDSYTVTAQARALRTLRWLNNALVDLGVVEMTKRRRAISHILGNDENATVDEATFLAW